MLPLLTRFDVVQEYTFVATLGWCLLGAEAAHILGLSYEIGAFTAGISIASSPVARAIAEHLKPLREFFLILFFFAIGARLNLQIDPLLLTATVIFGILLVPLKAIIFLEKPLNGVARNHLHPKNFLFVFHKPVNFHFWFY